ncbi:activin types 1 and 2 receptor protein [Plakobranchus ocellatus]|uniref:Activin types 1 and 2 receptor protein n=1 Tax=Plakobranchus ocellatus TaxID=259542 RepID=A0AAV4DQF9_9GAST|nr:activin types 1 and 2 receptor protein [Plakobranchus ocellatus]
MIRMRLVVSVPSVDSSKCYLCNSYNDSSCLSGASAAHKRDCGNNARGCRKWHFFFDAEGDGNVVERIARTCGMNVSENVCYKGYGANGKRFKRTVCECMGDFCNTAAAFSIVTPACIAVFSAAIAFLGRCL